MTRWPERDRPTPSRAKKTIRNYTKKSLKSHDLSDFSLGVFFTAPFIYLSRKFRLPSLSFSVS